MRKGFGLIQVIFFMVLMSGILAIAMKYASISAKQTADLYTKEQAELFMQSSIEVALLGLSDHNKSTGCIHTVKVISEDKRFVADINISDYFLISSENCDRKTLIDTEGSNGMIMMDIVVETNNSHPKNSDKVRVVRRTLQRL